MLLKASVALAGALMMSAGPAKARENGVCTNYTLRGSFGYVSWGTLLPYFAPHPYAGPFGEIGRQTFDGYGHTAAVATYSANGNISQGVALPEGTYTVNPDCTGSWTLSNPSGSVHANFVIDRNGTEIRAISTDAGVIETRVYRKQFEDDQ